MIANTNNSQIANVAAATYEDPMLDDVGQGFAIVVPITMPAGSNYGQALDLYADLSSKIAEYLRSLRVSALEPEYAPI